MRAENDCFDAYRATRRFGALDGLRALAAAAVVWHHAVDDKTGYFGRGVGVTTFFVLSGFLITRLLFRDGDRRGTISIGDFWGRRVLRIFPLYYAVLGGYVLLVAALEAGTPAGAAFWTSLPFYASFTTNWFVDRTPGERVIFYFAWSLAVQEQFYLIWPVILRYVRRRYAVLFPLGFLLAHDATGWLHATGALTDGLPYRVLAGMDTPIYFGVLAAIALENRLGFRIGHAIAGRRWSLPLALAATLLPGWVPQLPQDLLALSITYLVVACALAPAGSARLLDNRAAGHVGSVSYGIYLLHMLALNAVRRVLPGQGPAVTFALAFPLAVLVSTASYRWFEQPILRLRERSPATRHGRHPAPPSLVVSATEAGR